MAKVLDISTDTTAFPWEKRSPGVGLKATIAVAVALALGQFTGHESAGAIAAGAAFTVGFAVFHKALASTLLSMGLVTLGIASATLAGSLCAEWTPLVLLVVLMAAINYGLLSALGPAESWVGQQCGVFAIVASYFPRGVHYAVGRTSMVLLGGALQMLVFTAIHFLRRRGASRVDAAGAPLHRRIVSRIGELWTGLRRETRLRGPSYTDSAETGFYVARLAVTLLLCTAIYRYFHVRNGYWSPMTALLVLRPQWSNTLSRGIARFMGTLCGAGIALALARFVPLHPTVIFAMVIIWAWGSYALQAVNYAVFSLCVTLYIVFLFRFGGFSQTSAAHIRLFNTALGGAIALLVDAGWKVLAPRVQDHGRL